MPKSFIVTFHDEHPNQRAIKALAQGCDQKARQFISALKQGSSTTTQITIRPYDEP